MKYYYRYVLKVPEQPNKYLHFGSLVHALLESHFKNEPVDAAKIVAEYPLSEDVGGYERAKQLAANGIAATSLLNVRDVEHKFFMSIGPHYFVGYADIITADDVIVDWKTGKYTRAKEAEYREQTQYYAYLFWRKYNRLPKSCALCFVEGSTQITKSAAVPDNTCAKLIEYTFTNDDVLRIEKEILYYGALIAKLQRETAARQQSACMAYGTRCAYYDACHALTETLSVQIDIHGNTCQLNGHVPDLLSQGIDRTLSYDLKDKYWIQKRMQTKYGGLRPRNWEDIGRKKLYAKGTRTFNVGHLPLVKNLLRQFAEYKKIHLDIKCIDHRAPPVSLGIMPAALNTDKVLRPYQTEAINTFLGVGNGYLELATGSGKTIVTAEIIRQMDLRTLWVIDRKELLVQTRELFKQWLNVPIGQIGAGVSNPRDITVATIQSLVKNIDMHRAYLDSVQFVVIDESHHAAAESYQKLFRYLPNTKNRLGCTGTVKRDDGNEMILESLIGPVLYRVSAAQLIADGYLERPSIIFHTLPEHDDTSYDSYAESYEDTIVQNVERNALGASFVNGQTLIIVKKINHGEIMAKLLPSAVFIHGSTQDEIRTKAFKAFQDAQIPVLIGTIQIFSEGIDVPNLATIINLAGQSGEVKTIQMLGRLLRRSLGKSGCVLHDFCDTGKYGRKASKNRIKTLKNEGHEVEIQTSH
jgi:superfamily II DNA or RNA helicase